MKKDQTNDIKRSNQEVTGLGGESLFELKALHAPDQALPRERLLDDIEQGGFLGEDGSKNLRLQTSFFEGVITTLEESQYTQQGLEPVVDKWLKTLSVTELAVFERDFGSCQQVRNHLVQVLLTTHSIMKSKTSDEA